MVRRFTPPPFVTDRERPLIREEFARLVETTLSGPPPDLLVCSAYASQAIEPLRRRWPGETTRMVALDRAVSQVHQAPTAEFGFDAYVGGLDRFGSEGLVFPMAAARGTSNATFGRPIRLPPFAAVIFDNTHRWTGKVLDQIAVVIAQRTASRAVCLVTLSSGGPARPADEWKRAQTALVERCAVRLLAGPGRNHGPMVSFAVSRES